MNHIVTSIYFAILISICMINIINCLPMVLLSGIYTTPPQQTLNTTQEYILDAIQSLYNKSSITDDFYNIYIDGSINTNESVVYWSAFRYNNYNLTTQNINNTFYLYSNLNELNNKLKATDYAITLTSNLIFCDPIDTNPVCSDTIGPMQSSIHYSKPIAMNKDWNNFYNFIFSGNDYSTNTITVYAYLYITGSSNFGWRAYRMDDLFANGQIIDNYGFDSMRLEPMNYNNSASTMALVEIMYDNINDIHKDISNPNDWNKKFTNFYRQYEEDHGLIYLYDIIIVCSNSDICSQYYNYNADKNDWDIKSNWFIVAMIFIPAFCIVVLVFVVCLACQYRNKKPERVNYAQPSYGDDAETFKVTRMQYVESDKDEI